MSKEEILKTMIPIINHDRYRNQNTKLIVQSTKIDWKKHNFFNDVFNVKKSTPNKNKKWEKKFKTLKKRENIGFIKPNVHLKS